MKKYIQPTVRMMSIDSEDIMDLPISNTMGDEGQFINEGLFDELDDDLYDDVKLSETESQRQNYSSFHVWEK